MHLRDRQLWSADEPIVKFTFGLPADNEPEFCKGIALLLDTEKDQLKQFVERVIPSQPAKLPAAKFVEHVIDTQGHSPIKQRNHRMSPKVCDALLEQANQLIELDLIELFSQ